MTTVRIWDKDFHHVADVEQGWRSDEPNVIAVPMNHPVAKWILGQSEPFAYITVDHEVGARGHGRLKEFACKRTGKGQCYLWAKFTTDEIPSVNWLMSEGIRAVGDLTAMIPGVPPIGRVAAALWQPVYRDVWFGINQQAEVSKLERAVRAAQGHRAATYERLRGTYRSGHWHPKLADPRTLADLRLADAQHALTQALKSEG